jgi:precorrin-2 methylase
MKMTIEDAMLEVWRQALVEKAGRVKLSDAEFKVLRTAKRELRQVDFEFEGEEMRGLEQNPETKSRWAQLARAGKRVMQFLAGGRYVAVVVEGNVTMYGKPGRARLTRGRSGEHGRGRGD